MITEKMFLDGEEIELVIELPEEYIERNLKLEDIENYDLEKTLDLSEELGEYDE